MSGARRVRHPDKRHGLCYSEESRMEMSMFVKVPAGPRSMGLTPRSNPESPESSYMISSHLVPKGCMTSPLQTVRRSASPGNSSGGMTVASVLQRTKGTSRPCARACMHLSVLPSVPASFAAGGAVSPWRPHRLRPGALEPVPRRVQHPEREA